MYTNPSFNNNNQSNHTFKALIPNTQIQTMTSKNIVLNVSEWDTSAIKYMAPKINDKGGKSISLISKQTNRMLHITTPLMMTWGIADFVDEKGESDGKYSISLNFPNDEYKSPTTDEFLDKIKAFEQQVLQDAVTNAETWWGESMSLEVCKHTFFPILKYSKNKDTKKIDLTRPPSLRAKVPFYNGKWGVEIYDTKSNLIFPCENERLTPIDFVPKLSRVACGLQCTGIWIGGKGWGLTWKMFQCIVKPREVVSVYGKCHISLSTEDKDIMEKQVIPDEDVTEDMEEQVYVKLSSTPVPSTVQKPVPVVAPVPVPVPDVPVQTNTYAEDSDNEEAPPPEPATVPPEPATAPPEPAAAVVQTTSAPVKRIIKKKAP